MKRLEWLFHIMAFMLQCGGIVPIFLRTGSDSADLGAANPFNTIFTAFVLAITLISFAAESEDGLWISASHVARHGPRPPGRRLDVMVRLSRHNLAPFRVTSHSYPMGMVCNRAT